MGRQVTGLTTNFQVRQQYLFHIKKVIADQDVDKKSACTVSEPGVKVRWDQRENSPSGQRQRQRQRGEREPYRCANVFFQAINLSLATPQKRRLDEKGAVITQTKLASGGLTVPDLLSNP